MAPRGRARKRNTRMDGAIEAMTKEYGFSDEGLVRKVANELLQEYGGEDGWFFVEQYSYKELLEALLRYQEEIDDEKPNKRGDLPESVSLGGEKAEERASTDAAQPSGAVAEAICSEVINNGLEMSNQGEKNLLPPIDEDGKSWKDIVLDQASSSSQREKADAICDKDKKYNSGEDGSKSSILVPATPVGNTPVPPVPSPPPKISTPPLPVSKFPSKRRQPCYGWIESDDEEDADDVFIELKPAVDWEDLKPAKRKSRWDMRPEDP